MLTDMKYLIALLLLTGCAPEQSYKPIMVNETRQPNSLPMVNRLIDREMGYVIYIDSTGRLYPCPILRKLEQNAEWTH